MNHWLAKQVDDALSMETQKDPKSLLQEYLQGNGSNLPHYRLISETEPPADIVFTMDVIIDSRSVATGSGSRKIDAEREAARKALEWLKHTADSGS